MLLVNQTVNPLFMTSFKHIKTLALAKALGLLLMLLPATGLLAQPGVAPADVFDNGYRADTCYRHFYKAPVKLDTAGKAAGTKLYRIWRVVKIDNLVNKNLFASPEKDCERNDLFEVLKYGIRSGKINAYAKPDMNGPALEWATLQDWITVTDSVTESYLGNDGKEVTTARGSQHIMHSSELSGYVVCEDWYVDARGIRRERRIVSICPIYDREDEKRPNQPLFYVSYNDCRELFASFRATADEKGADMSFDEVFIKKKFESIVTKTENVYKHAFATYPNNSQDEGTIAIQKLLK